MENNNNIRTDESKNSTSNVTGKSEIALNEEKVLDFWKDNNIFEKTIEKESPKGDFVFYEGPPTANGRPGIHHLEARAFKDAIPRYKTMQGYRVERKGGWDTHGLPVELEVEKELGISSKKEIEDYGVAKFNQKCKENVWKYKEEWERFTRRIGYWLDLDNPYITYDSDYMESVWNVIKKISDRGLVYKDYKVLPWCPRCGTALSSHELAQGYEDVKDLSITAKFELVDEPGTFVLAWTTTPWTLPGNVALAVGEDIDYVKVKVGEEFLILAKERMSILNGAGEVVSEMKGSDLLGKSYKPLYNFAEVNEKAHKIYSAKFVTTEDGTGVVHTAVMYGQDDFELGNEIGLPKNHLVDLSGHFIDGTDFLAGRFVKDEEVAIDIVKDLAHRGLLFSKEKYEHSYPHCWRCKTPVIYYARDSWYIKMSDLRKDLTKANQAINWEPNHLKEGRFGEWLREVKDWAISRERYWGTPLPIWEAEDGERIFIGGKDELRKYAGDQITKIVFVRHGEADHNVSRTFSSDKNKNPLTKKGHEQAEETANKLNKEKFDVIYTSPVLRSEETANHFLKKTGQKFIEDDRLWEVRNGEWEDLSRDDEKIKHEVIAYKELPTEEKFKVKRGKTGESWEEVEKRVSDFIEDVIEKHKGKKILCFTHQSIVASAVKVLRKQTNEESTQKVYPNVSNASIWPLTIDSNTKKELDLHKPYIDNIKLVKDGKEFTRVPEVMDVWFDSGSMPYAQEHYPFEDNKNFNPKKGLFKKQKRFPADFISEAIDQTRGWFYTLHAIGVLLGYGNVYKNVISLGHILDAKGKKMSKSIGNVVNPWEMADKYGVDALRFWMYSVNQPGDSKNFDEKTVDEIVKKVFNLYSNVASFYDLNRNDSKKKAEDSQNVLDKWIISLFNKLVLDVTSGLDNYKLLEPTRSIREFIGDLSQWYTRRSRDRFKGNEDDSLYASATLKHVLLELSKLMAPFTPFISETIYKKVGGELESVHLEDWPKGGKVDEEVLKNMKITRDLVTSGLEARQTSGIKVRQPLAFVEILSVVDPKIKFEKGDGYHELIIEELNVKKIIYIYQTNPVLKENHATVVRVDTNLTEELRQEGDARELLRAVQGLRKDTGLKPEDKINLFVSENNYLKSVLDNYGDMIKNTAGIEKIETKESEGKKVTLTEGEVNISIHNVS